MYSSIFMHHLQVGGVHATYYDAPDFTAPRSARYASQAIGNVFRFFLGGGVCVMPFLFCCCCCCCCCCVRACANIHTHTHAHAHAHAHAHTRARTRAHTGGYPVAQVGWQSMSATAGLPGGSIATADGYSVRWAGFVSPTQDGVYTFQWARSGNVAGDRVKLWVDNRQKFLKRQKAICLVASP